MNEREQRVGIRARREKLERQLGRLTWRWFSTLFAVLIAGAIIVEGYFESLSKGIDFQLSGFSAFVALMATMYVVVSAIANSIALCHLSKTQARLDAEEATLNTSKEPSWPGGEGKSARKLPTHRPQAASQRKYCPPSGRYRKSSGSPRPPTRR